MSTKQTVIFTFMILFLAVTLFSLGAWFHFSSQLDSKKKEIDQLKLARKTIEDEINGTATRPGLRPIVEEKLRDELAAMTKRTADMKGSPTSGMIERQIRYEEIEKELKGKEDPTKKKWQDLYTEWTKYNGDNDKLVAKLKTQLAEEQVKTAEAGLEMDRELTNEQVKRKETVAAKLKMVEELSGVRVAHEAFVEKIADVTREARKKNEVVAQGRVIESNDDLKSVTIDMGRDKGVRKDLEFDVYSASHAGQVKKATIRVVYVDGSSSRAIVLPANKIKVYDPQTGWVPTDARMRFSIYSGGGPDETQAQELVKPITRQDKIETYRQEKLERDLGSEAVQTMRKEKEAPTKPPSDLGTGFTPILPGDWISNVDFVPIVPDKEYQRKAVDELLSMRDVNLSTLTFYFTDLITPYRKEYFRRLCERNRCKTADVMSADVNYIVTSAGLTNIALLEEKLAKGKDKEEVGAQIKAQRKALADMQEGKKIGSIIIAEDEVESFFNQRQRKAELLRGKTVQPGRSVFYVAGETQQRSVAHVRAYIKDHGGVAVTELDEKVDYVIVGTGLDQAFYDKVKRLGIKIMREDELPKHFGVENK